MLTLLQGKKKSDSTSILFKLRCNIIEFNAHFWAALGIDDVVETRGWMEAVSFEGMVKGNESTNESWGHYLPLHSMIWTDPFIEGGLDLLCVGDTRER